MNNYTWQKITDRIYLIVATYGPHRNAMQLLIGDEKAALIDTSMGATGNLRELVESITSLPVSCFITHMHPDHAGASMLFDERHLNPADEIHCWWALTKEKRHADLEDVYVVDEEFRQQAMVEMTDNSDFTFYPMYDGDIFDLGGITLEILAAEGHTEGSVVLFCKEENALFGGDSVAPKAVLVGEHKTRYTPLTTVQEHLQKIAAKTDENTKIFCGHAPKALPVSILDDLLTALQNVLAGHPSKETPEPKFQYEEDGSPNFKETVGAVSIIYNEASLRTAPDATVYHTYL